MKNELIKLMKSMEQQIIACAKDAEKFVEGNNSAGTRVRKFTQNIKSLAQQARVEVQNQKNSVTI